MAVDPAVVDLAVVAEWMDARGLAPGPIRDAEVLAGGTQNILIRFHKGDEVFVLRRPPLHLRRRSNDVIRREARVLAALAGTAVPAPRLIADCPDETVLGDAVFYLMSAVDGVNPAQSLPGYAGDPIARHAMGLAAADALATLGQVDHLAVGLADLGRPDGFLERQVGRWLSELDSYVQLPGYPGPDIPNLSQIADWLERNRPSGFRPGIMHGDYHLANLLYAPDEPRVAAIVDWEMCTIGDPLVDLGWLLATWPSGDAIDTGGALGSAGGLPGTDELVQRYALASERDLGAIAWYAVLACFKLGIVLEGTYARACAGLAEAPVGDRLHRMCQALFTRATHFAR
jgi:aminoglycoside phosphotransferase (APT) family kinase protein